ncbi:tetratricopeptide repeat protein [bacterium]|nr:tetratricopeptide repeat protein [bacterium]
MEPVNVVYNIGIITGILFCISIFLFYLSRIAVFFNRKRFKLTLYSVWSAGLILIVLLLLLHGKKEFRTRVSYFPLFDNTNLNSIFYADAANRFTDDKCKKDILVYPVDWYFSSLHPDSVSNIEHIRRRAEKFGLDYIVFVSIEKAGNKKVKFVIYNAEEKALKDSVYSEYDYKSIISGVRKISEILKIELNDSASFKFIPSCKIHSYSIGRKAQLENNYKKAAESFQNCLSVKDNFNVRLLYARCLIDEGFECMRRGDSGDYYFILARDALRKADKSFVNNPDYNLLWAELYIYKEMWNKASLKLKKVFKYNRNIPEAYFFLSRLHKSRYKNISYGSKIKLLKKAVYLNPAYKKAWLSLAQNLFAKGFYKEAEKRYGELISLIPECPGAYIGLAAISASKNNIEGLLDIYKKLISADPDDGLPYYNLGILLWKTKDFDKSEKLFQKAVSLNGSVNSYFYLGLIESEKGNKIQALKYFQKRVSLSTGVDDHFADVAGDKIKELLSTEKKGE